MFEPFDAGGPERQEAIARIRQMVANQTKEWVNRWTRRFDMLDTKAWSASRRR